MNIVLHARAAEEVERVDDWWRVHRKAAPDLFQVELRATLRTIETSPTVGRIVERGDPPIRRVLMPKTRYHVYYRIDRDTLDVLAIWHAKRGEEPELR